MKDLKESDDKSEKNLSLIIKTTQGSWESTFLKTMKVQEVINMIIQHFGYSPKGNYELRLETNPDEALKAEKPLVSYGIKDGDVLIFTDLGIAV
ncbi:MAG: hypothetical protein R2764_23815 [Bacteroidales bacterium]